MKVYNNNMTVSVWKNYTTDATNLRGSIARLSSGLKCAREDSLAEISQAQALRSKYREATAAAMETESRINTLQAADAWLQKSQTILREMADMAAASGGSEGDIANAEVQGRFELMQEELDRIGQRDDGNIFTSDGLARDEASAGVEPAAASGVPHWFGVLCDHGIDPSTPEGAAVVSGAADSGITALALKRKVVGGEMQRLESILVELRSHVANIRATETRIGNAELAMETADSAKGSITTQVGTAMLAQANALPGSVMTLIEPSAG